MRIRKIQFHIQEIPNIHPWRELKWFKVFKHRYSSPGSTFLAEEPRTLLKMVLTCSCVSCHLSADQVAEGDCWWWTSLKAGLLGDPFHFQAQFPSHDFQVFHRFHQLKKHPVKQSVHALQSWVNNTTELTVRATKLLRRNQRHKNAKTSKIFLHEAFQHFLLKAIRNETNRVWKCACSCSCFYHSSSAVETITNQSYLSLRMPTQIFTQRKV